MNILIALPHNYSHFEKEFAFNLIQIQQAFYEWVIKERRNDTLSIIAQGGYRIDDMRNELVRYALKNDITHIFFMDTDMTFPRDVIRMMVEDFEDNEDQGVKVISGLYTWKKPPFIPHVYKGFNEKSGGFGLLAQFPMDELFEIDAAGAGCLMVDIDIFKENIDPWFVFATEGSEIKIGEDLYFFKNCKPLTLCDPRIKCKHYSHIGFSIDDYIDSNNLERIGENFSGTKEQFEKIDRIHHGNFIPDAAVDKS